MHQHHRLLLFRITRRPVEGRRRYQELITREWETLSAEERIELSMLPGPTHNRQNGSDLARALFRFTQQAGGGGMDLDELMVILAEQIRTYLLSRGYVYEASRVDQFGRALRYAWSPLTDSWEAGFEE